MLITLFCVGRAEGEVRDAACFSCDICGSRAVIMHACPGAAVGPTCRQSSSAFVWDGGLSVFTLAVQDLPVTPANGVALRRVPWSQWLGLGRVAVVPPQCCCVPSPIQNLSFHFRCLPFRL